MRTIHFDCICGVTPPMLLGALVSVGAAPERITARLKQDGAGVRLKAEEVAVGELTGVQVQLQTTGDAETIRGRACDAAAECYSSACRKAGRRPAASALREVRATAAAADAALTELGSDEATFSPVAVSSGIEEPEPVAMELLRGLPVRGGQGGRAAVSAVCLAVLRALAQPLDRDWPDMVPERFGHGVETRPMPLLLRAILGRRHPDGEDVDSVWVIEANIDDMTGEALGFAQQRLLEAGALDVFFTPIQMKKSRPATLVSVICDDDRLPAMERILLRDTTTFGLRRMRCGRSKLVRDWVTVSTQWGEVRVKRGKLHGQLLKATPEYEDCRRLAEQHGIPLATVYEETLRRAEAASPD